jgi:hypothetical protein
MIGHGVCLQYRNLSQTSHSFSPPPQGPLPLDIDYLTFEWGFSSSSTFDCCSNAIIAIAVVRIHFDQILVFNCFLWFLRLNLGSVEEVASL